MMDLDKLNQLFLTLKSGDHSVLDDIYVMVSSRLYHIALAVVKSPQIAEDTLQDSIIALCRGIKNYRASTNPYGYIAKIVQNTAINMHKREIRKGAGVTDISECQAVGAQSLYSDIETVDRVGRMLSKLNSDERQVIILKYYSEMTVREIAHVANRSKSAVDRLIDKAEEKIAKLIKEGM